MEVLIAKTAGFCFGVSRAVSRTYDLLKESNGQIYTIGPIIHNEQLVNNLKERGVKVIGSVAEAIEPGNIVIRAHGVVPEVYEEINNKNLNLTDATCPYVKKIHNLVREKCEEGYQIIIIGDRNHPEVVGINGWCNNKAYIADNIEDIDKIPNSIEKACVVAQTTITNEKWENLNKYLKNKIENIIKFDTICSATSLRQSEAAQIAKQVEMMLVIGSRSSSNTQKLYEICKSNCNNTYIIETSGELPPVNIKNIEKIGITAGASTPDWIIKEVIEKMDELNRQENEMSFKEAFESSLVTLQTGEIVKGKIVGFNNAEVYVDMGFKSDGIIPMDQFSDDLDFDPEESLKVGDEIEVFVVRVNDGEGNVLLSKKKVDAVRSWSKIEEAYETKSPIKAKVVEVVNGGLVASFSGIRIFIPASQVSDKFVKDLNDYLKQTLTVRIIEYNKQKRKVVGSQRVIIAEGKERLETEVWSSIEAGKKYDGVVKSLTDFGVFVDIGGVDGLIHLSELSWTKIKHPSQVMKIGDKVEVTVLEFDREKKRISLGYRKMEDNPWFKAAEKFKVGDVVKGKVVRIVPFGAFVELEDGVDGLVHISQISSVRIAKPGDVLEIGQEVEAKVIEFNHEAKKISLSIKEVNPIDPPAPAVKEEEKAEEKADAAPEEITPSEHKEDMNVTLGDMLKNV